MILSLFQLVLAVLCLVSLWKVFEKLGEDGWKALVPIYNVIVLANIFKWETLRIILLFIPLINIIFIFLLMKDLAARFGKGVGYAVGLLLLYFIFLPLLAFKGEPVQEEVAA